MAADRSTLTDRQREVLDLLEDGKPTQEIAKKLKMTPNGVYQHRRRLEEKGLLRKKDRGRSSNGRSASGNGGRAKATASTNGAKPAILVETAKSLSQQDERLEKALAENRQECDSIDTEISALTDKRKAMSEEGKSLNEAHRAVAEAREKVGVSA